MVTLCLYNGKSSVSFFFFFSGGKGVITSFAETVSNKVFFLELFGF